MIRWKSRVVSWLSMEAISWRRVAVPIPVRFVVHLRAPPPLSRRARGVVRSRVFIPFCRSTKIFLQWVAVGSYFPKQDLALTSFIVQRKANGMPILDLAL